MQGFRLQEERAEVKAWTDMIALRSIPVNKKEVDRLRAFEAQKEEEQNQRKKRLAKSMSQKPGGLPSKPERMASSGSGMGGPGQIPGGMGGGYNGG